MLNEEGKKHIQAYGEQHPAFHSKEMKEYRAKNKSAKSKAIERKKEVRRTHPLHGAMRLTEGVMHGNKETAKGRRMEKKHEKHKKAKSEALKHHLVRSKTGYITMLGR